MDFKKKIKTIYKDKNEKWENQIRFKVSLKFGYIKRKKHKELKVEMLDQILNILVEKEKYIFPNKYYLFYFVLSNSNWTYFSVSSWAYQYLWRNTFNKTT